MSRFRPTGSLIAVLLTVATLFAGCTAPSDEPGPTSTPGPVRSSERPSPSTAPSSDGASQPAPSTTPSTPATPDPAPGEPDLSLVSGWTLKQKVGQVVMVGLPVGGPFQPTFDMVRQQKIGGVFLHGRTQAGRKPVKNLVDAAVAASDSPEPLYVATDQEGGAVQVLRGTGFSTIPSALDQAALSPSDLRARSQVWGDELARAGVNLNLAPVMDLVPKATAASNAPIGAFGRNYGYTAKSVTTHANAFAEGQRAAGVQTTIKHFPGLGRVTANTDTTAGVTDTVTGPDSPSVAVFGAGIKDGTDMVMMSSATYTQIDPKRPAVFSPTVVGLVREHGFDGVIITDDLSAAVQVQSVPAGQRAVRAVRAGVDLVLASAEPSVAPAMVDALVQAARKNPAFADKIDAAAARVVAAKSDL